MPIVENQDPLEARLDPETGAITSEIHAVEPAGSGASPFNDDDILRFLGEARRLSRTYQQVAALGDWEQSQSAYRSEHSGGSKYHKDQYKNRARYFKPKTRAAVRKNLTATAAALFSSRDVMSVTAENDSNQMQRANAALIKELIDHRFNSKTRKIGVPWFETALGARFDTQVMGACCSKQTWTYRCVTKKAKVQQDQPVMVNGQPLIDPTTGQPFTEVVEVEQTHKDVIEDKPTIALIPSEMVLIDPGTSWIDPAQNSPTLIVIWPMHIDDVKAMMNEEKNLTPWRQVSDDQLRAAMYSETEIMGLRAAREGSGSGAQSRKTTAQLGGSRNEIVEARECFWRRDGVEYHCWTLKEQALLSDPVAVEEVYPAHRGSRPYVIGTDVLEPHVLYKQSHVRSWKQSQDEINDFSNLRMDATRQSVFPTAKVVAGKNIDYKAVQRRDGQGIILVRDQNDVTWDRAPGPPPQAQMEVNLLSNDFDEIAGIFSQNSVQSNRSLNETVGGMQIISANANATSSFDLMCFIQTWAEPVLSQIVALEQYYEDDANLLAIAGDKGKLFQRYGIDEITDELLESQIQLELAVGIGSSDPMQQLAKFKATFEIAMPLLSLAIKEGRAKINYEEVFSEIFGKAGYRNGAERFIQVTDQSSQQQIPPEKVQELMGALKQLQQQNQDLTTQLKSKQGEIVLNAQVKNAELKSDHVARMAEIDQKNQADWNKSLLDLLKSTIVARIQAKTDTDSAMLDAQVEAILGLVGGMSTSQAQPSSPMAPAAPQMGAP